MPPSNIWINVILVGVAAVLGLSILVDWTVEYLWLKALEYESIFWRLRDLKVGFFLGSLAFSFVLVLFYRGTLVQAAILSLVLAVVLQMFFVTLLGVFVPPGDWTSPLLEAIGL